MTIEAKIVSVLSHASTEMSIAELSDATETWSPNLYPVLLRMEQWGKIVSRWGDGSYPRQRLYRLPSN